MGLNELVGVGGVRKDQVKNRPKFQALGEPNPERWIEMEKNVGKLERSSHSERGVREATRHKCFKVEGLSSLKCYQEASKTKTPNVRKTWGKKETFAELDQQF